MADGCMQEVRFTNVTSAKAIADRIALIHEEQKKAVESGAMSTLIFRQFWPGDQRDSAAALNPLAKDGVQPFATDMPTFYAAKENLLAVIDFLRSAAAFKLDFLVDLTAVDFLHSPRSLDTEENQGKRFQVVYLLRSMSAERRGATVRLCVPVGENEEVPSLTGVWPGANWPEREVFDLMGIRFSDHPNMRRIVLPDNYRGHPLRKDFPVKGIGEDYLIEDLLYKRRNTD